MKSNKLENKLFKLNVNINQSFEKLTKPYTGVRKYFCDDEYIENSYESTYNILNDVGAINDLQSIYYNTGGIEKEGRLLGIVDDLIVIIDMNDEIIYKTLEKINLVSDKINIISNLEKLIN